MQRMPALAFLLSPEVFAAPLLNESGQAVAGDTVSNNSAARVLLQQQQQQQQMVTLIGTSRNALHYSSSAVTAAAAALSPAVKCLPCQAAI
jgi:transcription initiation factor TFIID subunit TAF12